MKQANSWNAIYQLASILFVGDEVPESENQRQARVRRSADQAAKEVATRFIDFNEKELDFNKSQVAHLLVGPVADVYERVVDGSVPSEQIVSTLKLYLENYYESLKILLARLSISDSDFAKLRISKEEIHAHRGPEQSARTTVGQMFGWSETTVRNACRDASDSVAFVMKDAPAVADETNKFDGELIRQILEKTFQIPRDRVDCAMQVLQG
ncbi:MAG: hypothetical protein AB7G93_11310 [Bdellovibrionales bacterium]